MSAIFTRCAACRIGAVALVLMAGGAACRAQAADPATYRQDVEFLKQHTKVIEFTAGNAKVAVCPEYQGRVMTSTTGGDREPSFGWINRKFIAAGKQDKVFNNYGGEDRFWLSPEAGQFALFFAPKVKQVLANCITPASFNEGPFEVVSDKSDPYCRMTRRMDLLNAAGTRFSLDLTRTVRQLQVPQFASLFGSEAGRLVGEPSLGLVGFETDNTITNRGDSMSKASGLPSIWSLGQFKPGPNTWIVVPYRAGETAELGPIVDSSYFFDPPADRLKILAQAVLFKGDAQFRSKIGINQRRVLPVLGSIDFDAGVLTLVSFSLPREPAALTYLNNLWHFPQAEPYVGDVANSYNDGPTEPGAAGLGGFYELETLSPAAELKPGQSLRHIHRTFHIQINGPKGQDAVNELAELVLGVSLKEILTAVAPKPAK